MRMLLACAVGIAMTTSALADLPTGDGKYTAQIASVPLDVYTYRPPSCVPASILLVFHGIGRNADGYRDHAKPLADAGCALVFAPLFDKQRFPRDLYQYGGVAAQGSKAAGESRTVDLIAPLAAWAGSMAGRPGLPVTLLGHSGGAQFVDRVAAYSPFAARRIIIANPSTWVLPSVDTRAPWGFGGLGDAASAQSAIRAYLAKPITVLLGGDDTTDHDLAVGREAMAQGPNRLQRGLNTFKQAQQVAQANGWVFAWKLLEVPGIGHDATKMFASPQARAAFLGD